MIINLIPSDGSFIDTIALNHSQQSIKHTLPYDKGKSELVSSLTSLSPSMILIVSYDCPIITWSRCPRSKSYILNTHTIQHAGNESQSLNAEDQS